MARKKAQAAEPNGDTLVEEVTAELVEGGAPMELGECIGGAEPATGEESILTDDVVEGYALFIEALVECGSDRSEAAAQFRFLLDELAEPNEELAALLERSPRDGDGLIHYMRAIEAGLTTGGNSRELFRSNDAWLAYRVFVRFTEELDELVSDEPDGPGADIEHDGSSADVEPEQESASDPITTDELLRERPLEPGGFEMKTLTAEMSPERREQLAAESDELALRIDDLEHEKKAENKRLADEISILEERRLKIAKTRIKGEEESSVRCRWYTDWTNGVRELVRMDTDEVVETRAISWSERQQRIDLDVRADVEPPTLYNHFRCNACSWTWQVEPTSNLPADAVCPSCDSKAISLFASVIPPEPLLVKPEPTDESPEYREGYEAFEGARSSNENPYDAIEQAESHQEWLRGYDQASDDEYPEDGDPIDDDADDIEDTDVEVQPMDDGTEGEDDPELSDEEDLNG